MFNIISSCNFTDGKNECYYTTKGIPLLMTSYTIAISSQLPKWNPLSWKSGSAPAMVYDSCISYCYSCNMIIFATVCKMDDPSTVTIFFVLIWPCLGLMKCVNNLRLGLRQICRHNKKHNRPEYNAGIS